MQNVGQVKSFVDDLVMKLGTVSMRVALVLRSAEVQPVFQDLCIQRASACWMTILPSLPPVAQRNSPLCPTWLFPHNGETPGRVNPPLETPLFRLALQRVGWSGGVFYLPLEQKALRASLYLTIHLP